MPMPFFSDFTKLTKDYFKRDKYDLGNVVEISSPCGKNISLKSKISTGDKVKTKFTANFRRDGREFEVTEDLNKGLSLKVKLPGLYKGIDVETEHSNADVTVTAKYRPGTDDDWYSCKMVGYYNPDAKGLRVCSTKAELAFNDNHLGVTIGGQIQVEDTGSNNGDFQAVEPKIKSHQLGFMYTPCKSSQYLVMFTPDSNSFSMNYSFTCFKKVSSACALVAKADGVVDTKLTAFPPVMAFGGGWTVGSNYMQAFFNTRKEFGMAYKVKVSDTVRLNLGLSSFLNGERALETRFGYKLQV